MHMDGEQPEAGFLHALLFRAAFLPEERALHAWWRWKTNVNLDTLDPISYQLLPQVYLNLRSGSIDEADLARLKGVYRRTWYANGLLTHRVVQLLPAFRSASIDVLALSGTSLALADAGRRSIAPFELLVPVDRAVNAIERIEGRGWKPTPSLRPDLTPNYVSAGHAHSFRDGRPGLLRLHWRAFPGSYPADADDDLWRRAVTVTLQDTEMKTLDPADRLLHSCASTGASSCPLVHRAADATTILLDAGCAVDWDRVIAEAGRRHLVLPLQEIIAFIQTQLDGPLPEEVAGRIEHLPVSPIERRRHASSSRLGRVRVHWRAHTQRDESRSLLRQVSGFPAFLQHTWRLERTWHLPIHLAKRALRRWMQA